MSYTPSIPLTGNLGSSPRESESDEEKRKKRRSAVDVFEDIKNVKKTYKNLKEAYDKLKLLSNPGFWIVAIIILVMVTAGGISISQLGIQTAEDDISAAPVPIDPSLPVIVIVGLDLKLSGPVSVDNGQNLEYTIEVNYSGTNPPLSDIVVYAVIPSVAEFVEASGAFEYSSGEISWPMSQNGRTFTFTLHPTVTDAEIQYRVYARTLTGTKVGAVPTANSCGGRYNLASVPIGLNFGDPTCIFTKDDLYSLFKQLDPTNADYWYFKIVPCESGYSPLAYNQVSTSGTAWGLFQMGHEEYPAFGIPKQMNNQYDRGDVDWSIQTSNAINYNKQRGNDFAYWACK